MKLIFTPQNPEFCLLAGKLSTEYVVEIMKATIQVPRVSVKPSAGLPTGEIQYYFVEHRMIAIPVPESTQNFNRTISTGPIPRRLIMSQMSEKSFEGQYKRSCFKFPHFNLDSIQVTAGAARIPTDPLTADWANEEILEAYTAFFSNMKNSLGFTGMPFTREEYKNDRTFFSFDLTKDQEAGGSHWSPGTSGNLALSIHWKNALAENIVIIACLEYECVCKLDKYGNPQIDYAPVY